MFDNIKMLFGQKKAIFLASWHSLVLCVEGKYVGV